ncbi:MAG: SRPBCC family protein, partial [Solirubrobacterales bacterium]
MAHYATTVNTDWDPEAAFRYLAEFSNVADWDPGVSAARNISDAPLESGARFEVEASFLGRTVPLTYETIEIDSPRRVTLRAATGTFTSLDTL